MKTDDAAPDFRRGYLRVPLSLWVELYCRAPLTRRQLQLISVVLRESWGWQRQGKVQLWTRPLAPCQLARLTGLSTDHLRRDVQALVERGILRQQQQQQYQLVPDPQLWKTRGTSAPKRRARAPKDPGATAETALPPPGLKIEDKKQRKGRKPGDKSLSSAGMAATGEPVLERAWLPERFCQVVEAFAGSLSAQERQALRHWIAQDGVAVVWQALAEPFRRGPPAVRRYLAHRLGPTETSAP